LIDFPRLHYSPTGLLQLTTAYAGLTGGRMRCL